MLKPIVFIRGLNTRNNDNVHIGPWSIGGMNEQVGAYLRSKQQPHVFLHVDDSLLLSEQVDQAIEHLENYPLLAEKKKFHIVGHSYGGIIARALVRNGRLNANILSAISIGCPHHGAGLADAVIAGETRFLNRMLKERREFFRKITRDTMAAFNADTSPEEKNRHFSVVCHAPVGEWSLPFHALRIMTGNRAPTVKSDGLLEAADQNWGECLGEFTLDHLDQIGYHHLRSPLMVRKKREAFERMWDAIFSRLDIIEKIRQNTDN